MSDISNWVIYGLRLRTETEYRYVGQTQFGAEHRLSRHRHMSKYRDLPVCKWLRKHDDIVVDVLETVPEGDLFVLDEREIHWIASLRDSGHRLLNCTSGGQSAYSQTEESRQKRVRSGKAHYNYGKHHSDETREKLSAARRLRVTKNSTREKMSQTRKGQGTATAKLTEPDIRTIRKLSDEGVTGVEIARRFNVTPANISSILKGKTWSHVI